MTGEETLADRGDERPRGGEDREAVTSPVPPFGSEDEGAGAREFGAGEPDASGTGGDDELAKVAAERDEYLDALRRLQAEFENFRKRTARQQSELLERGSETVIQRILPALDALDLALAHVGERADSGASELDAAFVQIGNLLRDVLAKEGLERIDATGVAFDPTVHDAVAHVPAEEIAGGPELAVGADSVAGPAVVETLRAGYRLKGRVLRPAMVKVRA